MWHQSLCLNLCLSSCITLSLPMGLVNLQLEADLVPMVVPISPAMILVPVDADEVQVGCEVFSDTEVTLNWIITSYFDSIIREDDLSNPIQLHLSPDHEDSDVVTSGSNCTTVTASRLDNLDKAANQSLSTLIIDLHTDEDQCLDVLRNTSILATCLAENDFGFTSVDFDIVIPHDFDGPDQWFSWRWWTNSTQQRRYHRRQKQRAVGFIIGMIVPIIILFYIVFNLSCFRSALNMDANMFGADST